MTSNKELTKTVESLVVRVKSVKDQLKTITGRATHNDKDPQSGSGLQNSSTGIDTNPS